MSIDITYMFGSWELRGWNFWGWTFRGWNFTGFTYELKVYIPTARRSGYIEMDESVIDNDDKREPIPGKWTREPERPAGAESVSNLEVGDDDRGSETEVERRDVTREQSRDSDKDETVMVQRRYLLEEKRTDSKPPATASQASLDHHSTNAQADTKDRHTRPEKREGHNSPDPKSRDVKAHRSDHEETSRRPMSPSTSAAKPSHRPRTPPVSDRKGRGDHQTSKQDQSTVLQQMSEHLEEGRRQHERRRQSKAEETSSSIDKRLDRH